MALKSKPMRPPARAIRHPVLFWTLTAIAFAAAFAAIAAWAV